MADPLTQLTAVELAAKLAGGETTARAVMEAFIARTQAVEPSIHAFNSFDVDDALAQADAADARRARGQVRGPLDGIPVAIKDLIAVKGQPLTCSSRILETFVSPYDAHVTERLRASGAVLWGRLNMDEFAMGSSTENSAFGPTHNPWDTRRVPGGSSGGCSACVAAAEAPLSLGSDTGGSIRQPAAFCGVVGLKPTYGLVSRYGLVAFASSLDQIGPFAHTVEDAALLLQAVAGHDERDSTSVRIDIPDYTAELKGDPRPWRLGVPKEYFVDGLDPEIRRAVEAAIEWYASRGGCEVVEVSLSMTDYALPVYYIIAPAEASSNLARYDGIRYGRRSANAAASEGRSAIDDVFFKSRAEGFGSEVKRRIILGTYALSSGYYDAYYKKAQQVRTLIREDFNRAFAQVDALLTPATPTPAFALGERTSDPVQMYLNDIFTINANLAGLPAISVPCGLTEGGLPIGLQVIGQSFKEAQLLRIARHFEQAHDFAGRFPMAG